MKLFTVAQSCKLKEFTDFNYPQGAFRLNVLIKKRDIKVNGVRVGQNIALNAGDEVIYYTTPVQEAKPSHFTVYEDANILVADKLSGVTSEGLLSELCGNGDYRAVHRLDRNTQGLIVFAKTAQAEAELLSAFKERRVQKTYLALCKNSFKERHAVLTAYLVKDEKNSLVHIYGTERKGAVKIITEYTVLENRGDIALVEIALHTGKTHQIRAHTAYIGCSVLGDNKYGDSELNKKYKLARQCLVAKRLVLTSDGTLKYLCGKAFESRFLPETK